MSDIPIDNPNNKPTGRKPAVVMVKVAEKYIKMRDLTSDLNVYFPRVHRKVYLGPEMACKTATKAISLSDAIERQMKDEEIMRAAEAQNATEEIRPARWWDRLKKWLSGWLPHSKAVKV